MATSGQWCGALALLLLACAPLVPARPPSKQSVMSNPKPASPSIGPASASPVTFDHIAAFPPPGWQIPRNVQLAPDGALVTYLQAERGGDTMALFSFSLATQRHQVMLREGDLTASGKPLSREEELRRERQRSRIQGVTSYAWAERANVMLVPLGGNVFVRLEDGTVRQLTSSAEPEIDPKISADGRRVAFARGRELFVVDVQSGAETQLSKGAPEGVTRGQSDFNGQEELNEPSGHWWAPGGDRLAYLEVAEGGVAELPIMGYRDGADLQQLRYPRAGGTNPRTRLGVVELASRATTWIAPPDVDGLAAADQYLGRVVWSRDGKALFFQRLSRDQQRLALVRADVASGKASHVAEASATTWIEMTQTVPLGDGSLLWLVRRDGHQHIERLAADGKPMAALTAGDWDVFRIVGVDDAAGRVLFVANRDGVLDRHLYARALDGSGDIARLTKEPGVHDIETAHVAHGWVDVHSSNEARPRASIVGRDGAVIGEIAVPLEPEFAGLELRPAQLVELAGQPNLHGALLTPTRMEPGVRYPVIVMVYGGPGAQSVANMYTPRVLWQHLADRGVVVWQLDNRGSAGRGHAFEAPIHRRLGEVELADQLKGLDYLATLPFVDMNRVGIYGHSYGGYLAALAMLRPPKRFKVAVAGSPVTDWRFYDTGYTERFMGTPADNAAGYDASSLIPLASGLEGKLLLIHSLMDENVHFQHTAAFIDALIAADRDFDLLVFPGERHGYRSPTARRYAYRRVVEYFAEHL
jgi:dipeptidyl-peptidase-4